MERFEIAQGVHVSTAPAEKFNRCRISVHFSFPANRATATAHALLPLIMERGYADCPDMTALTKKLAKLYGANLAVYARSQGGNRNLCVSVTGIKDAFALEGEALCAAYAEIALGAAFRPYLVDGVFDPQAVEIEKPMLKKSLEDELNDKQLYCARQAQRTFYQDGPAAVRPEGYLEEVDGLDSAALMEAYQEMLRTASIELVVLGCGEQTQLVVDQLRAQLARIQRTQCALVAPSFVAPMPVKHCVEQFELVQAKLCMAFTTGCTVDVENIEAYRLAMSLFGGSVTSRLFLNVREKLNICYYCSCVFQSVTGAMFVHSGVEPANAQRAEEAILNELQQLCDGPITDEELEDCRRGLLAGLRGVEDSLGGMENWYYMQILRGGSVRTPEETRASLLAVTKEDVRAVLKQFTLSVSYLVTAKEVEHA